MVRRPVRISKKKERVKVYLPKSSSNVRSEGTRNTIDRVERDDHYGLDLSVFIRLTGTPVGVGSTVSQEVHVRKDGDKMD